MARMLEAERMRVEVVGGEDPDEVPCHDLRVGPFSTAKFASDFARGYSAHKHSSIDCLDGSTRGFGKSCIAMDIPKRGVTIEQDLHHPRPRRASTLPREADRRKMHQVYSVGSS